MMAGTNELLAEAAKLANEEVRIITAPCLGACDRAPAVADGHALIQQNNLAGIKAAITTPAHPAVLNDYIDFNAYRETGGYKLVLL